MAVPIALPVDRLFTEALKASATYPRNLLHQATYSATLDAYQQKIDNATTVFETPAKTNVLIHDLDQTRRVTPTQITGGFTRRVATSLQQLKDIEGVRPNATNDGVEVYKSDPKCRVIFLWADQGRARLKITKEMTREILTFHQIMPGYVDLLLLFGSSVGPNDLKFAAFREQSSLSTLSIGCDRIYRSGQQYEICYNLKTIGRKDVPAVPRFNHPARVEWSIKQAAVYHKFDIKFGTTVWMFTRGALDLEQRFTEVIGPTGRPEDRCFDMPGDCFRSSLAMHAFMIHWASESWPQHLQFLDEKLEKETKILVNGSRKPGPDRKEYTARDLQALHVQCDTINDAILAIEGNIEIVEAIRGFYKDLPNFYPLQDPNGEFTSTFLKQSKNAVYDLKMQISRARALAGLAAERKNLMLHYINAQIAEKQEDLTNSTYAITKSAEREAIVVRIITIVTLLYLPATFVSTFFSAPLINFQSSNSINSSGVENGHGNNVNNNNGDEYDLALHRWLEITVPLTVITMLGALVAYVIERRRRQRQREREKGKAWA